MISLIKICEFYFKSFSEMDTLKFGSLFADDISLEDWNVKAYGWNDVMDEIINIFNSVKTIKVRPMSYYEDGKTVCCEILIQIDDKEIIQVMDVITFNDMMKIQKIKAYKI